MPSMPSIQMLTTWILYWSSLNQMLLLPACCTKTLCVCREGKKLYSHTNTRTYSFVGLFIVPQVLFESIFSDILIVNFRFHRSNKNEPEEIGRRKFSFFLLPTPSVSSRVFYREGSVSLRKASLNVVLWRCRVLQFRRSHFLNFNVRKCVSRHKNLLNLFLVNFKFSSRLFLHRLHIIFIAASRRNEEAPRVQSGDMNISEKCWISTRYSVQDIMMLCQPRISRAGHCYHCAYQFLAKLY